MDTEIALQDKNKIFTLIKPACSKWKEIARLLGLSSDTVSIIESKGVELEKALHDVISAWINGKDKAKMKGITRLTLVRALKHSSVKETVLAETLEESWQKESKSAHEAKQLSQSGNSCMIKEKVHRTPSLVFQENVSNICDAVSDADTYVLAKDFLHAGLISGPVEDDIMTNKSLNRLRRIKTLLRDIRNQFKSCIVKEDELLSRICSVLHSQDNLALSQIADQMCKDCDQPILIKCSLNEVKYLPPIVDVFQKYLKELYISRCQQSLNAWPPIGPVEYVNLEIIENQVSTKMTKSKQIVEKIQMGFINEVVKANRNISMNLEDMEEFVSQHKFILVEGAPGIGKTTFANKICQDWAKNISFTKFKLVVYIPLRYPKLKIANSLADLLEYYYDDKCCDPSLVQYIRSTRGRDVLFVLDGWDELNQTSLDEIAFLPRFIGGGFFPNMHIIVTSRPVATQQIKLYGSSQTGKIIQIIGFTEENVREYICAYKFAETPAINVGERLLEELHKYPNVMSACYVAINATIICYVYEYDDCKLPSSLTEVYDHFVFHAVKRSIKKIDGKQYQDIIDLDARSLNEFSDPRHTFLIKLCDVALNGILNNVFSFEKRSFSESCGVSKDQQIFDGFGLVQFFTVGSSRGPICYCYFLHLTIQEFLAAYSISMMKDEFQQLDFLLKILRNGRHPLVVKFFFGLCQTSNRALNAILYTEDTSETFWMECVHEAKSKEKCEELAKRYSNILSISHCILQPYQALACGSVMIESSSERWRMEWIDSHIGTSELKILHQCLKKAPETLKNIVVKDCEFESKEAEMLMIQIAESQNIKYNKCGCEINGTIIF